MWRTLTGLGDDLWGQYQNYLSEHISSPTELARDRLLDKFFDPDDVDRFWGTLAALGVHPDDRGTIVDLKSFDRDPELLASAFEILINSDNASRGAKRNNKLFSEVTQYFTDSLYGEFHRALFNLCHKYDHVGLRGKGNYGLTVAHRYKGTVSIVTGKRTHELVVGEPR